MTQKQLEELCHKWQAVLRVSDWRVTPRLVTNSQMSDHNRGECHLRALRKEADILICHDDDLPHEKVLIHELIHVLMEPLDINSQTHEREEEQVVNILSDVLYSLAVSVRAKIQKNAK